ncbi:MAG: long-chain fatty acid transporter, partial [Bacteroidetes bacterium]
IRLDALRLRAGYALDQVPVTANLDYKSSNQRISAGVGLHKENFFADFTIINSQITSFYSPYTLADNTQPDVQLWTNNFSGLLTLGFSF